MKYLLILLSLIYTQCVFGVSQAISGLYTSPVYYWVEPKVHAYTVDEVREDAAWTKLEGELNFSYSNDSLWFMQTVKAYHRGDWILQLSFPLIDYVDLYVFADDRQIKEIHTGDALPYDNRPYKVPYYLLELSNDEPESFVIIGRLQTRGIMLMPMKWWAEKEYLEFVSIEHSIYSAFYGILIVMAIYHLFVFIVTREKNYLYYVLTVTGYMLLRLGFDGRGFAWLWPNLPMLNDYAFHTCYLFYQIAVLTFISSFLELQRTSPILYRISIALRGLAVASFVAVYTIDYSTFSPLIVLLGSVVSFFGVSSGAYLWFKGYKAARLFTVAWTMFLIGFLMVNLRGLGLVETTWYINYGVLIGSMLQILLFGFSLADRIQTTSKDKLEAEKELVKSKDEHLRVLERYQDLYEYSPIGNFQSDQNYRLTSVNLECAKIFGFANKEEMLEKMVDIRRYLKSDYDDFQVMVRTARNDFHTESNELFIKTEKGEERWVSINLRYFSLGSEMGYEGTVQDITERKLAEALKEELDQERINIMEQFSLGIAKKINTPLGSNVATTAFLREGLQDILQLQDENKADLHDYASFVNLTQQSLNLVANNQKRISKVVKRFKEVSSWHLGLKLSHVVLSDVIENAVNSQRWRMAGWRVDIDCDPSLQVYTYRSALNLILLQLIDNALLHSEADDGQTPSIQIQVAEEGKDNLVIIFSDNGVGIKRELVKNLCRPFFTTKKGPDGHIGLGLYMIYNLVGQALKGRLLFPIKGKGFSVQVMIPKKLDKA